MNTFVSRMTALGLAGLMLAGCAADQAIISKVQADLSEAQMIADIKALSADEFGGRKPDQPGGPMTVDYLLRRVREIGLQPGNGDSYLQEVKLKHVWVSAESRILLTGGEESITWKPYEDFTGRGRQQVPEIAIQSDDLIIVGYGIADTVIGWDQFGDIDYTGKTVIIFRGEPGYFTGDSTILGGIPDRNPAFFSTKFANARAKGAAAAFVILDVNLSDSDFGWEQLVSAGGGQATVLDTNTEGEGPSFLTGYINPESAKKLFATRGLSYQELLGEASKQTFEPIEMGYSLDLLMKLESAPYVSPNVLAVIPGRTRPDEIVMYSAHWDHVGTDTTLEGDQIFNGAADNASGTASLLTLATAFANLEQAPERTVLFLWVTAEESGLLGSRYYAEHPVYPLGMTVAALNIDMLIPFGETRDVIIVGYGKSELDRYAERAAKKLGMYVQQDLWPEENFYFRSDHISFARKGVPALSMETGMDHLVDGQDSTLARFSRWQAERYHKVADVFDDTWEMAGIMNYLRISFDIGYTLSNQTRWPNWAKDDEFRPVRDASRQAAEMTN